MHRLAKPLETVLLAGLLATSGLLANGNVHVSRFWHNHQPLYWPELNTNGGETSRSEHAWDSISLKFNRSYAGSSSQHPESNLTDIFGKADRVEGVIDLAETFGTLPEMI